MKKIAKVLSLVALVFLLTYCIGSFYNANFNLGEWSLGSRFVGAVVISFASALSVSIYYTETN